MPLSTLRTLALCIAPAVAVCAPGTVRALTQQEPPAPAPQDSKQEKEEEKVVEIQFLEIVTPDVKETCGAFEAMHGVRFGEPEPMFGNARTAALEGGGLLSVRAPLRETEEPVVRPYALVDDIEAAVKVAKEAGAEIAMPPMKIPEKGTFAIYILGGIEHGLWQL